MTKEALLRAYHDWLDEAKTRDELRSRMLGFLIRHFPDNDHPPPPASRLIFRAHAARVDGEGSPAECSQALKDAIKELTR